MTDEDEAADDAAYDNVLLVAGIVAALVIGGLALGWADGFVKAREARTLEGVADLLSSWRIGSSRNLALLVVLPLWMLPILGSGHVTGALPGVARLVGGRPGARHGRDGADLYRPERRP